MVSVIPDAEPAGIRLHSLTSLRFFAAFMVVGFHLRSILEKNDAFDWVNRNLFAQGNVGVSFFFILSGFVLTWSRRPDDTTAGFYWRRFARIYPNHLATFAVAAAVIAYEGARITAPVALTNLFLVQPWIPRLEFFLGINGVAWSLGCEMFFYALFPFLIRPVARMSLRARRLLLIAVVALVPSMALPLTSVPATSQSLAALYVFPPVRLLEFVLGILLAREVLGGSAPRMRVSVAVVASVLAYLAIPAVASPFNVVAITLLPFMALIVAAAQSSVAGDARILHRRTLVFLGEASYALYLVHQLVIRAAVEAIDRSSLEIESAVAASILAVILSLLFAALLYTSVERPAERRLRRWWMRRPLR